MTIYTRRGDEGITDVLGGERVSKTDPRIESYGTVDELNALVGTIRGTGQDDVDRDLASIQQDLHIIQAALAMPGHTDDDPHIGNEDIVRIEDRIDYYQDELDPLDHFIVPGGGRIGAGLHHARAVCRRAERRVVQLAEMDDVDGELVQYLNRLSDLLFVLARVANRRDDEREERPTY